MRFTIAPAEMKRCLFQFVLFAAFASLAGQSGTAFGESLELQDSRIVAPTDADATFWNRGLKVESERSDLAINFLNSENAGSVFDVSEGARVQLHQEMLEPLAFESSTEIGLDNSGLDQFVQRHHSGLGLQLGSSSRANFYAEKNQTVNPASWGSGGDETVVGFGLDLFSTTHLAAEIRKGSQDANSPWIGDRRWRRLTLRQKFGDLPLELEVSPAWLEHATGRQLDDALAWKINSDIEWRVGSRFSKYQSAWTPELEEGQLIYSQWKQKLPGRLSLGLRADVQQRSRYEWSGRKESDERWVGLAAGPRLALTDDVTARFDWKYALDPETSRAGPPDQRGFTLSISGKF